MKRVRLSSLVALVALPLTAACGGEAVSEEVASIPCEVPPSSEPAPDISEPRSDRRIEAIEAVIRGGEASTSAWYGGAWGVPDGRIVVAATSCSMLDSQELSNIAGGPDVLNLIEVPFSFSEVDGLRDTLLGELTDLGVAGQVLIDSTETGRHIRVEVLDVSALPSDFGGEVPSSTFSIVETEHLFQKN